MKPFKFFFLTAIFLTLYFSCYYDKEELLYPPDSASCDTTNVTYKSSVTTVLGNSCLSCHSNSVASSYGGNIKLQDYADVKLNINRVYGAIAHQNGFSPMPKGGGSLDDCSIRTIKIWMDAGSPNN